MRLFIFSVFSFLLFSCSEQKVQDVPILIKSNIHTSQEFKQCAKFEDGFVVITEQNELLFLDENFEIDPHLTKKMQPKVDSKSFYLDNSKQLQIYAYEGKRWVISKNSTYSETFFEDDEYTIIGQCNGEFGGTAFFEHKKTKETYCCETTCLVEVNKLNDTFYLTCTLNHMMSFSYVLKVEDPTKLTPLGNHKAVNNWWLREKISRDEIRKGTEMIIKSPGEEILDTFITNNQLYIVHEREHDTRTIGTRFIDIILSTYKEGKLTIVDTLHRAMPIMSSRPSQKTKEYSFFSFDSKLANQKTLVTIKKDTIEVVTLKTGI